MTEDEYLLAQCRQHRYDPDSPPDVVLGRTAEKIFDRPKVVPAGEFDPPDTNIHITEGKHNKASANYTHAAHTNLTCVLDILAAIPDTIVYCLFSNEEHTNQASALELLQALDTRFTTLQATDVVKIKAIFNAPYDTGGTINEYL